MVADGGLDTMSPRGSHSFGSSPTGMGGGLGGSAAWWAVLVTGNGWRGVHAFSFFLLAVLAVSDLVRMWSLHMLAVPLRSFAVLAGLWLVLAVPGALFGRYLGSQARPLFAVIDLRWVWIIGAVATLLMFIVHVRPSPVWLRGESTGGPDTPPTPHRTRPMTTPCRLATSWWRFPSWRSSNCC